MPGCVFVFKCTPRMIFFFHSPFNLFFRLMVSAECWTFRVQQSISPLNRTIAPTKKHQIRMETPAPIRSKFITLSKKKEKNKQRRIEWKWKQQQQQHQINWTFWIYSVEFRICIVGCWPADDGLWLCGIMAVSVLFFYSCGCSRISFILICHFASLDGGLSSL